MQAPRPAPFPFTKIIIIAAGAMVGISFFALSLVGSRVRSQSTMRQAAAAEALIKAIDEAQEEFRRKNGRYTASVADLGGVSLLPERSLFLYGPPVSCAGEPFVWQVVGSSGAGQAELEAQKAEAQKAAASGSAGSAPTAEETASRGRFHEQARVADAVQAIETFGREDCPDLAKSYVMYVAGHPEGKKSLAAHIWRVSEGGQSRQIMP